jgi:hypothetical protein
MRKLLLVFSVFIFGFSFCQAQDTLVHKSREKLDYQPIIINAGIGGSLMELAVPGGNLIGGGGPAFLYNSPAFNATLNYNFTKKFSIGIGGAYEWFTDHPGYGQSETASWETEKISRYNVTWIVLYHFSKLVYSDAFTGLRIGASVWNDQITSNTQNYPTSIVYQTMSTSTLQRGCFQLLFGYQYFPIYNFGLHAEIGIGTPYFAEAGISIRFKTRKVKT